MRDKTLPVLSFVFLCFRLLAGISFDITVGKSCYTGSMRPLEVSLEHYHFW